MKAFQQTLRLVCWVVDFRVEEQNPNTQCMVYLPTFGCFQK